MIETFREIERAEKIVASHIWYEFLRRTFYANSVGSLDLAYVLFKRVK